MCNIEPMLFLVVAFAKLLWHDRIKCKNARSSTWNPEQRHKDSFTVLECNCHNL